MNYSIIYNRYEPGCWLAGLLGLSCLIFHFQKLSAEMCDGPLAYWCSFSKHFANAKADICCAQSCHFESPALPFWHPTCAKVHTQHGNSKQSTSLVVQPKPISVKHLPTHCIYKYIHLYIYIYIHIFM